LCFTVDFAGLYVALQKIFREANLGGTFDIKIMPLGHTIYPHIAINFFEDQKQPRVFATIKQSIFAPIG
jgi:hypothetical protein